MNTLARMGTATGQGKYFEKQFANFKASALDAADYVNTFGFWNATECLFYRDERFLGSDVFWGRGNGWAIGGLVQSSPCRIE